MEYQPSAAMNLNDGQLLWRLWLWLAAVAMVGCCGYSANVATMAMVGCCGDCGAFNGVRH